MSGYSTVPAHCRFICLMPPAFVFLRPEDANTWLSKSKEGEGSEGAHPNRMEDQQLKGKWAGRSRAAGDRRTLVKG